MKIFSYLSLLLLCGDLLGCKPRETNLTGQVFIATAGGTSFKLGAVEIQLIEKQQVVDFLNKQQTAFELKIQSEKGELNAFKKDIEKAKVEADNAQMEFDSYVQSKTWQTNDDYIKIEAEFVTATNGIAAWDKQMTLLISKNMPLGFDYNAYASNAMVRINPGILTDSPPLLPLPLPQQLIFNQAIQKQWEIYRKARSPFLDKAKTAKNEMHEIERTATEKAEGQNNARHSNLYSAQSHFDSIQASINTPPTPETYLADFSPIVSRKAITDADGNFSVSYPKNKRFTIYARAQRAVLDNTEKYCWLMDAPSGVNMGRASLNNQNLVELDPDGYFKMKPQNAAQ